MSRSSIFEWQKLLKEGRELVQDDHFTGRPSPARTDDNLAKVRELLNNDRRLSIEAISDELNMAHTSVQRIIHEDFAMRQVCAKMVWTILTADQKETRLCLSQEVLNFLHAGENFWDNVVTGYETWVFQYHPETKGQSTEWHTSTSPRPKKARMSKSRQC